MREVFASEGVPQDLAYLAMVESAFRPAAYSRAKAKGVWQFISDTGKRYGLEQDWWVDERSDTEKATRAAARYLKELYAMFGDWNLAMAGYNAGEGVIQRGDRSLQDQRLLAAPRRRSALRRETKNYVPLIHAADRRGEGAGEIRHRGPAREPMPAFERVPVEGAIDLRVIAECTETPLEDIQQLNPELRRLATPAGRTLRRARARGQRPAPRASASQPARRQARGASAPTWWPRPDLRHHRQGQRRAGAATWRAPTTCRLDRRLAVGTELIIPIDPRRAAAPARHPEPKPTAPPAALSAEGSDRAVRVSYRIKPGDTLAAIASQYGTTVAEPAALERPSRLAHHGRRHPDHLHQPKVLRSPRLPRR